MCVVLILPLLMLHDSLFNVTGEASVNAPAIQEVVANSSIQLQCSVPFDGTLTNWVSLDTSDDIDGSLNQVNLDQQGRYTCSIVVPSESSSEIYTTTIELRVLGKIMTL